MNFDEYQHEVVRSSESDDIAHELLPMLGLGGHVGELLLAQQRYLCESLVAETTRGIVGRELGLVLRSSALIAQMNGLALEAIVRQNLVKIDRRAQSLGMLGIEQFPMDGSVFGADDYQRYAAITDQEITAGVDPLSLSVPMLGLAGETGNLLVENKKRFRGDSKIAVWSDFIGEELGDLLWYVAAVARHLGLTLSGVMTADLKRLAMSSTVPDISGSITSFDRDFPVTERIPRQLQLHFQERQVNGKATVSLTLIDAAPNAFPKGPIARENNKVQGFSLNTPLGDEVNDNSRREDAYRYHDAIHLGFLAVLGWSPTLRNLLHVKRKSVEAVDDAEDGARAIFAEEGLAAILAKQASVSRYFERPNLVPESLLDLIETVVDDLEVHVFAHRTWRESISQGFTVMQQLKEARGGYVFADLDTRSLKYSKFPFPLTSAGQAGGQKTNL